MAHSFCKGLTCIPKNIPVYTPPERTSKNDELLILILLFILFAASPALGLDSRYFFIIIMSVIGLGGIKKAFGI
jgi:hypothetical protein